MAQYLTSWDFINATQHEERELAPGTPHPRGLTGCHFWTSQEVSILWGLDFCDASKFGSLRFLCAGSCGCLVHKGNERPDACTSMGWGFATGDTVTYVGHYNHYHGLWNDARAPFRSVTVTKGDSGWVVGINETDGMVSVALSWALKQTGWTSTFIPAALLRHGTEYINTKRVASLAQLV